MCWTANAPSFATIDELSLIKIDWEQGQNRSENETNQFYTDGTLNLIKKQNKVRPINVS